MIKKLRRQITATITGMVALVLLCSLGLALFINHSRQTSQVKDILHMQILNRILIGDNKNAAAQEAGNSIDCVTYVIPNNKSHDYIHILEPNGSILACKQDSLTKFIVDAEYGLGKVEDTSLLYFKEQIGDSTYIATTQDRISSGFLHLFYLLVPVFNISVLFVFVVSIFISRWCVKPIKENMEQQKHFITNASHDLKTPIAVMKANNSLLLENTEKTIESQKQWIESNKQETDKMLNLVNQMLDLLKSNKKKLSEDEKFNLSKTVQAEVLSFESVAYENNVDLVSDVQDKILLISCKHDVEKIISTLLENAFKHAEPNDVVTVALKGNKLKINNKLSRIDQQDLLHIFDRFYMADKSRANKGDKQSHGLGLAIAKELADRNNIKLIAQSDTRSGTTFMLVF